MKWPLAPWALCLTGGIVAGDVLGVHWSALLILLAGLAGAYCWPKHTRLLVLVTLCFVGGWGNFLLRTEIFSSKDLRVVLPDGHYIGTLEGTLLETPREHLVIKEHSQTTTFSTRIAAERFQLNGEWHPVTGQVHVQCFGPLFDGLYRTRRVQVTGALGPPSGASGPGLFDFREHLAREGIYFQLTSKPADWQVLPTEKLAPFTERFRRWAMAELQGSLPAGDQSVMLNQAMSLGWKPALMGQVSEPFIKSGTMHLFAISGLHVALIAVIVVELLRGIGVSRVICGLVLIPLLWFYTAATGWQASAIRSAVMMSVIGVGWVLERPSDLLNSLATAAFLLLLLDPQQLFQPGFQLSFLVVLSMAILTPPVEAWRQKFFQPDPFLPPELRPRWQRWLDWPVRFLTVNAVTSFAAWLGSLPLIAYYFHLVTPVSLIANLVLVPLSSLALMAASGTLLLAWWPPVADLFAHAAWQLMEWMVGCSEAFAEWPWAWQEVPAPGAWFFLSYYTLLFSAFAVTWESPWRKRLVVTFGLAFALNLGLGWYQLRETVQLTILDVSGGDAHVFEGGRHYEPLLIDTGNAAAYEHALQPFLQSRAIAAVPRLLLTHGDARHVGGAPALIADYGAPLLITSPVASLSPGYRNLILDWTTNDHPRLIVTNGSRLGPWQVLHPQAGDRFRSGDDNAIVLLGEFAGVRVLMLSDLGRLGQRALLERHPDLRADIVVTGIPAREEPLMADLLAALAPQAVIVTCTTQPASEQAAIGLRERLAQGPWTTWYVSDHGSITVKLLKQGGEIHASRGREPLLITARK